MLTPGPDSEVVADNMLAYQRLYCILEGEFDGCELNYVFRANNTEADELAIIGSTRRPVPPGVFLESINQRLIKTIEIEQPVNTKDDKATKPEEVAAANQSSAEVDED